MTRHGEPKPLLNAVVESQAVSLTPWFETKAGLLKVSKRLAPAAWKKTRADRNSILVLHAAAWECAICDAAMLQVQVASISNQVCACSSESSHVFRRRHNVLHIFHQTCFAAPFVEGFSSNVAGTFGKCWEAIRDHVECAFRLRQNWACAGVSHFFASEGHMTSDSACASFMAWLKCMSTCQCRCREEVGWSFCGVFAVCLLLWWAPCRSVQAWLVVEVWLPPHCVRGTDLRSHFRTPGAAQKQGRKVCLPTVCGRPFRTPFWATDR